MSHFWISSLQGSIQSNESPISCYFPFGYERQKMKSYIFQQLHGKQTLQNEQILKKFRQQALRRRHRYLHRYSQMQKQKDIKRLSQQQNFPTLMIRKNPQSSFISSIPKQRRYNSLVPREKSPPPIFKYSRMQGIMDQQITIKSKQTIKKRKPKLFMASSPSNPKKRAQSVQIRAPFKEKALANIKQIARKKRYKQNKQGLNNSTYSSQMIQQLQLKVKQSKLGYDQISKQLKRFKKYRTYLKKILP